MIPPWPTRLTGRAFIHCHKKLLPVFAATADDCKDNEEQSDYFVAAMGSSMGGCFSQQSCCSQKCPKGSQRPLISSSSSQQEPNQTQLAKQAGLCRNYFIYGEKTYNCCGNCSWKGN